MKAGSDSAPDLVIAPGPPVYQAAGVVEVPAAARIFKVGTYIRSVSGFGNLDYRICVWAWSGSLTGVNRLLGRTAVRTVSPAATAPGNLLRQVGELEVPVEIALPFTDVLVGVAWETDPDRLVNLGGFSGTGSRYVKELANGAGWPQGMDNLEHRTDHNFSAWIEDYEPLAGIFVHRAGEWLQIWSGDTVMVHRGGVFSRGVPVKVRRAGAWVNVPY